MESSPEEKQVKSKIVRANDVFSGRVSFVVKYAIHPRHTAQMKFQSSQTHGATMAK